MRYRDSLAQDHAGEEGKHPLVLANPPFAGSLDYENCAKGLQQIVKTKKTTLLFLAFFLKPAENQRTPKNNLPDLFTRWRSLRLPLLGRVGVSPKHAFDERDASAGLEVRKGGTLLPAGGTPTLPGNVWWHDPIRHSG